MVFGRRIPSRDCSRIVADATVPLPFPSKLSVIRTAIPRHGRVTGADRNRRSLMTGFAREGWGERQAKLTPVAPGLGILFVVITGCAEPPESSRDVLVTDSGGVQIVELPEDPWSYSATLGELTAASDLVLGRDDSRDGHDLFGIVGGALLDDGRVAIANAGTSEIRVFRRDGTLSRRIGRQGAGPGEFRALSWIGTSTGDTLLAWDPSDLRITVFGSDGSLLETRRVSPPELEEYPLGMMPVMVGRMNDGTFVFTGGFNRVFSGSGVRRDTIGQAGSARVFSNMELPSPCICSANASRYLRG
jgi:hypothetical protein